MENQLIIRKAYPADAPHIAALLAGYAERGVLLPRSCEEILESIRDFFVADATADAAPRIIACSSLRIYDALLAEVRSIAVEPSTVRSGLGKQLLAACEEDARAYGIEKVFALTYVPEFFERSGYTRLPKEALPQKIWRDCFRCKNFPNCTEIAVIKSMR